MPNVVAACDVGTRSIRNGKYPKYRRGEDRAKTLWVGRQVEMQTIIERIIGRADGDKLRMLRIFGHGRPASMQFGRDGLDLFYADLLGIELKGHFAHGGRIEIHSCRIGDWSSQGLWSTGGGVKSTADLMFQSLANYSRAEVWVPALTQYADDLDFEGEVDVYEPAARRKRRRRRRR